jgi:hypothetical protein
MMQPTPMEGLRFGALTVIARLAAINGRRRLECRCDCGRTVVVSSGHLNAGSVQSCGCVRRQRASMRLARQNYRHGCASRVHESPTYAVWKHMIQRCTNPNVLKWKYWGGRGITVCERWRDFCNFLADMGERPAGLTLDRINNDGNYEPGNCRWTTYAEQNRNQRPRRSVLSDQ